MGDDLDDTLTNLAKPLSAATITIRVIKSFEYRVAKPLVMRDLDLETTTVGELKQRVKESEDDTVMLSRPEASNTVMKTQSGWKPYKSLNLAVYQSPWREGYSGTWIVRATAEDALYYAQTTNLIINLENDEWILDDNAATLASVGFENETEVSFFCRSDYDVFKASPEIKWD